MNYESRCTQISRLHAEAGRRTMDSRTALDAALVAAWQAGKLLCAERVEVQKRMARGAWAHWLAVSFRGPRRTAERYMRLAATIGDEAELGGLSLRQAYFRLAISTEPKQRTKLPQLCQLP